MKETPQVLSGGLIYQRYDIDLEILNSIYQIISL